MRSVRNTSVEDGYIQKCKCCPLLKQATDAMKEAYNILCTHKHTGSFNIFLTGAISWLLCFCAALIKAGMSPWLSFMLCIKAKGSQPRTKAKVTALVQKNLGSNPR